MDTAAGATTAPVELTHRTILVAFSGLMLVMLLAALDSTIVSTALPTIVDELGAYIQAIVDRAGETLSPLAAWLLVRIEREPSADVESMARGDAIEPARAAAAVRELEGRGLLLSPGRMLTPDGCRVLATLIAARREHLAELVAEWNPREADAVSYLRDATRAMVPDVRPR